MGTRKGHPLLLSSALDTGWIAHWKCLILVAGGEKEVDKGNPLTGSVVSLAHILGHLGTLNCDESESCFWQIQHSVFSREILLTGALDTLGKC
jgi:hypothetical protein